MRSYTHAFLGLALGASLVVAAGCAQDDTPPAVHSRDLGTQQGEILLPYEPAISKKVTVEPGQYQMQIPAEVTEAANAAAQAGGSTAAEVVPADASQDDEYAAVARQMVTEMSKGEFRKVTDRFDEAMQQKLAEAEVQALWERLVNQGGAFQTILSISRQQATVQGQTMEVASVACKFEHAKADVRVALNAKKQVSGIFLSASGATETPAAAPAQGHSSSSSGSSNRGLGDLPPTAPAPIGLGN